MQILQQVISLERQDNARHSARNREDSLFRQNREAEAVKSSGTDVNILAQLREGPLEILSCRPGERNDEDLAWLHALFEEPRDAPE